MNYFLQWKGSMARQPYRTMEEKMEALEWVVRFCEYLSMEEQTRFMNIYREMYQHPDLATRDLYIKAPHLNESVLYVLETLNQEFTRLADVNFTAASINTDSRANVEKRVNVALVCLESMIINDKCLDSGINKGNLFQILMNILHRVPLRG